MMTTEVNRRLTQVGPTTPMGDLLRRYWHPIAGASELHHQAIKAVRLFGEDLVLFRTLAGTYGLIGRRCVHRGAELTVGFVEHDGIRCGYHGWHFNRSGICTDRPFDRTRRPGVPPDVRPLPAYPVQEKAGLLWAYLGPQPAPELPDWDVFHWPDSFTQIATLEIPCNWLQCQENAVDPVHFEWLHNNLPRRQLQPDSEFSTRTLNLQVDDAPWGLLTRRYREGSDTDTPLWRIGRAILWPNGWYFGHHFEWKVPIDDHRTLLVIWAKLHVPTERTPYHQNSIPTWHGQLYDDDGRPRLNYLANQDIAAWVSQGVIADRTQESLSASDVGVVMLRRRLLDDLDAIAHGLDPRAVLRDPTFNVRLPLPCIALEALRDGLPLAEMQSHPLIGPLLNDFYLLAGQPPEVKAQFEAAMGVPGAPVEVHTFVPQ